VAAGMQGEEERALVSLARLLRGQGTDEGELDGAQVRRGWSGSAMAALLLLPSSSSRGAAAGEVEEEPACLRACVGVGKLGLSTRPAQMRMASAVAKTVRMQRSSTCLLSLALLAWRPGASFLACLHGQQAGACLHWWWRTHCTRATLQ